MLTVFITLTHWGRVTHIYVSKLAIIGPDNGLSPGRRQAIIWTNAGMLLIRPLGTNFNEIEIYTPSLTKMYLKMSSGKWRPFCLGLNVLTRWGLHGDVYTCLPTRSSIIRVMALLKPMVTDWFNKHSYFFNHSQRIYVNDPFKYVVGRMVKCGHFV